MKINTMHVVTRSTLVALGIALLSSCGKQQGPAQGVPAAVAVTVTKVEKTTAPYYQSFPAVVKALNEVELRAQVSGYITGIYFKEGDQVKKGQKLYTIDQQTSEASYKQAQANLSVQEANLVKAKKDVERYRELDKQDAIAKQQLDYAESAYDAAQQQVEAARAGVRAVQTNVRYSTITAPFDGTIGISSVRMGAAVTPGQTLLNTISSDNPMAVDILIDQNQIFRFSKLLNSKETAKPDSTFRLAFQGQPYAQYGKLSLIDRAVDPLTGTITMRVVFANPDHVLRAGMTGVLEVLTNDAGESVLIPYKAISEQLGEFFVYVAADNKASQRRVKLGQQIGEKVIVNQGLEGGETIVVEGIQNLREGSAINVAAPTAKQ